MTKRDPEFQDIANRLVRVADHLTSAKRLLFEAMEELVAIKSAVAKIEDQQQSKPN